jgi:aminomethyltransferase
VPRTPLYERHLAAGGRIVDFAGWEMPQQYSSVKAEQEAVRAAAGIFDVSHMGRLEVRGRGSAEFLQGLVTNDLSKLHAGQAQYSLLCREDGGVVDDLIVYRSVPPLSSGRTPPSPADGDGEAWLLVVNAANRAKDLGWLRGHAPAGVEVRDRSDETCLVALQGPLAEARLPAEGVDRSAIPHLAIVPRRVAGVEALVARTGYTGEDGYELFASADHAARLWDGLLEAGAVPCGLACRDVCRLEAGLRLYGSDMDEETNPYEAGLGWTVKLQKGDFVGRPALQAVKSAGPRRVLVGLECTGRTIPRHGADVHSEHGRVGAVTSGTYSFWLEKGIGFASVEAGSVTTGDQVAVGLRGREAPAAVVPLPFYRGSVGSSAVKS